MKRIEYQYLNGKTYEHTKYITKKSILREYGGAKTVDIYEKTTKYEEVAFGTIEPVTRRKFVTTLLLD